MSSKYEIQTVTVEREVLVETRCDGCGVLEQDAEFGLIAVAIEVNLGEEFGRRDDLDYCDDCLRERSEALIAAGSRAEFVTGVPPEGDEGDE